MDARRFAATDTLRNGTPVTVRAVRPDDAERIAKAFHQLDRQSVYTRFFAYKSELSSAELARIEAMDFVHEVMLIATIEAAGGEIVIGSARYVAYRAGDGEQCAEVAFTVEEDYQRLGLAGRMLGHLIAIARQSGIARFVAEVLPDNKAMLSVLARTGFPMREDREDGVVRLTLELSAPT